MSDEAVMNGAQQPEPATPPEDNGAPASKTFTQDEVNKIISERLARERAKAEPDPMELRERELTARESAWACKEYLAAQAIEPGVLELFDTGNADAFKEKVEKLKEICPYISRSVSPPPMFTGPTGAGGPPPNLIAEAFKLKG